MIVSAQPTIKRTVSTPPARSLAYEQQIARPDGTEAAPGQDTSQKHAMVPADAAPAKPAPAKPARAHDAQPTAPAEAGASASEGENSAMAGLPPGEGAEAADPGALPWKRAERSHPAAPGEDADSFDPRAGEDGYPSDPMAALPGEDADPNAWPDEPQEEPQEWVQVLVSGAGMHGAASEDAPALFAFPYGRTLRVVSRYEGWVEVTDPQSAATGWMQAQYLAPIAAPRSPEETEADRKSVV